MGAVLAGSLAVIVRFACEEPEQNSSGQVGLEAQVYEH